MGSNKKLLGYYPTGSKYLPIKVDSVGKVVISGGIPSGLIAIWDYENGDIPAGWSFYEARSGYYSADRCVSGTPSASCSLPGYLASRAFDNNEATYWNTDAGCFVPGVWLKYDFYPINSYVIRRVRMKQYLGFGMKNFLIQGITGGADWTTLSTCLSVDTTSWQNFDFANTTGYRFIRLIASTSWYVTGVVAIYEVEMQEYDPSTAYIIKD